MAPPRLHVALGCGDDQPVRHAGHAAGAARSSRSSCSTRAPSGSRLLTTAEFLPFLLFTLPAGVWVDRLRAPADPHRRRTSAAPSRFSPSRSRTGSTCSRSGSSTSSASRSASAPSSSTSRTCATSRASSGATELVEGNAKLEIEQVGRAGRPAPASAGILVSVLTAPVAILRRRGQLSRLRAPARQDPHRRGGHRRVRSGARCAPSSREGLGYVFRHPYQRGIVAAVAISNFFGQLVFAILLVFAVRELDLTAAVDRRDHLSSAALGTLLAALTARPHRRPARRREDDPRSRRSSSARARF